MTRVLYWLGVFLLTSVVAHVSFVLFMPAREASALQASLLRELGPNSFHRLQGLPLRRLVRHPLPDASYGVCVLDLAENRAATLRGPDLRTLWALTAYSPRGDVIYAITDRHVPHGALNVRFEYRPLENGEIALPQLRGETLIVPLAVRRAIMVLEAYPWHPGQVKVVRDMLGRMRCRAQDINTPAPDNATTRAVPDAAASRAVPRPVPRARPVRAAP